MNMNAFLDYVTSISSLVTAFGVIVVWGQLKLSRDVAQLQFEDSMAREYRDLCTTIPSKVFLGEHLDATEQQATFDEFYRYIDLSNEQVSLRIRGRIGDDVWKSWSIGIRQNLELPAFAHAWSQIEEKTKSFQELRALVHSEFTADPKLPISRWRSFKEFFWNR